MSTIQRGLPGELRAARASSATRSATAGLGSLPPGLAARLARAVQHTPEPAVDVARMEVDPLARATLLAGMAERVLTAWLAQPLAGGASSPGGVVMLHLAVEIDTDAATRSAQAGTARGIRVMQIGAGSPQATAWQAGYLDGRAGRVPRFNGPGELEADYWRGVDAALCRGGA